MNMNSILSHFLVLIQNRFSFFIGYLFNSRTKKLGWLAALIVLFLMYLCSSRFSLPHRHFTTTHGGHREAPKCLGSSLDKWYKAMEKADAVVKHIPSDSVDHEFLPFIGNGFIGLSIEHHKNELYILNDTKMGLFQFPFLNMLHFKLMGATPDVDETIVLNIKAGKIHHFSTFNGDEQGNCVVVEQMIYIHRQIPGVIEQHIKIENLRHVPIHGRFEMEERDGWKREIFPAKEKKAEGYSIVHAIVKGTEENAEKIVAIASSLFAKEKKIAPFSSSEVVIKTAVRGINLIPDGVSSTISSNKKQAYIEKQSKMLIKNVKTDWMALHKQSLDAIHTQAWEKIWNLGIRIDSKDDPHSPSPLNVNITEYFLYSLMVSPSNTTIPYESKSISCFNGPPTMQSSHFWVLPSNIDGLLSLAEKWKEIFFNYGCKDLVLSGMFGLQRAVILSFTGLHITQHGLELAVNPISVSSNVSLRHVPYKMSLLYISIRIMPPDGIKTVEIRTEGSKTNKRLYACGSACENIVDISGAPSVFVAKSTNPVTPILYVSSNRTSLEMIKKSSFIVKAARDSGVDGHRKFAAHHFRLSKNFWFAVVTSIVLFHVIVIKMIYTECRKDKSGKRTKSRAFIS